MIEMTPELAEIFGIHAGDGYLRKRGGKGEIDISGSLEEKEYYDNHVVPLFNKIFNLKVKGRYFSRGSYGFVIYSKKLAEFFNSFGFPYGKKSLSVSVPEAILRGGNKKIYSGFLRGLLDTDGHIGFKKSYGKYSLFKRKHHHYPLINLTTVSKFLAKDTCFMLNGLGIKHFVFSYQPKDPRDSYKYVIIISGVERIKKWMQLVGSKNSVKFTRYLIWKKFGFCPTHTTLKQRKDLLKDKLDIYTIQGL